MVTIHNELKKEMIGIIILLIVGIILFKIIFHRESFLIILKLALSLFWLFILPGFMIMYLFSEKLDFIERIIVGTALGMAFYGVLGYNLGVLGLLMRYQIWILPALGIMMGIVILIKDKKISSQSS